MNLRYDTIDDQDLLTSVDHIELFLANVDQSVDQMEKNQESAEKGSGRFSGLVR